MCALHTITMHGPTYVPQFVVHSITLFHCSQCGYTHTHIHKRAVLESRANVVYNNRAKKCDANEALCCINCVHRFHSSPPQILVASRPLFLFLHPISLNWLYSFHCKETFSQSREWCALINNQQHDTRRKMTLKISLDVWKFIILLYRCRRFLAAVWFGLAWLCQTSLSRANPHNVNFLISLFWNKIGGKLVQLLALRMLLTFVSEPNVYDWRWLTEWMEKARKTRKSFSSEFLWIIFFVAVATSIIIYLFIVSASAFAHISATWMCAACRAHGRAWVRAQFQCSLAHLCYSGAKIYFSAEIIIVIVISNRKTVSVRPFKFQTISKCIWI